MKRIVKLTDKQITQIYNEHMIYDFPKEELKPLDRIIETMRSGLCEAIAMYDEEKVLSYAVLIVPQKGEYVLLDYFAVVRECRSMGIGREMFEEIKLYFSKHSKIVAGMFIECESEESSKTEGEKENRKRRISFYSKCGCNMTSLRANLFGVEYVITFCVFVEAPVPVLQDLELLYSQMFKKNHFDNRVKYWDVNEN